jgi:hypothetical protein
VDAGRFTIQYATIAATMDRGATAPCAHGPGNCAPRGLGTRARLASGWDNFHRMLVPLRHGLQRAVVPDDVHVCLAGELVGQIEPGARDDAILDLDRRALDRAPADVLPALVGPLPVEFRAALNTVNDYMKQGLPFKQALRKALQPLMGKTLVVAPQLSARPFVQIAFKLAGLPLPQFEVLDDSKSLVLAKSGRIDFATPEGAPITLTFEQAGWAPLVSPIDLLQNVREARRLR